MSSMGRDAPQVARPRQAAVIRAAPNDGAAPSRGRLDRRPGTRSRAWSRHARDPRDQMQEPQLTTPVRATLPRPRDAADAFRRRAFLAALGLLASPIAVAGQPAVRVFKVGLVSLGADPARTGAWEP